VLSAAIVAVGASGPAMAAVPTTNSCKNTWIYATGTTGVGAGFVVSARPSIRARLLNAHVWTNTIWDIMWRCVPGGYPGAKVTPAQGESLYQQLYCHIKWGRPPRFGGDTWDLEASRPPISWDRIIGLRKFLQHKCNW
jgi:hypothetical protein